MLLVFVLYSAFNDAVLMLTGEFCGMAFLLSLEMQPKESSQFLLWDFMCSLANMHTCLPVVHLHIWMLGLNRPH